MVTTLLLQGQFLIKLIGLMLFITVDASLQVRHFDKRAIFTDINRYLLYTRRNRDSAQTLEMDNDYSIRSSNFDPSVPTAVLIHGWQSQPSYGLGPTVRKALLDKSDVNVIIVDWRRLSTLDYVSAVTGVPNVGRNVGRFLQYLNSRTGVSFSSVHLIGHSLGAHIAGNAGRELGGRVARLTGLDPAGPMWGLNPNRLKPTDAIYVEAIHTDSGTYGTDQNVGHVDFYPNGGSSQPGCLNPICDHGRSYELFAASISTPGHLIGNQCSNLIQMRLDQCRGGEFPLGNNDLRKTGRGIYRLNTGRRYPY